MICEKCDYKEVKKYIFYHAFDVSDKKAKCTIDVDICTRSGINITCDDAYLNCPYREIKVEAQDIQHAINLLKEHSEWMEASAIDHLNKILQGEIE